MNGEKEKLDKLVERIDELLVVLNRVSEDLRAVSQSIHALATPQVTQTAKQMPTSISTETSVAKPVDAVRAAFPEELEHMLLFEDKGDYIMIKPKQFLGSENFAKIASAVRGMGGEYISAGRDSHFRVYKKNP
ncbi:MAG: hypothetical protein QXU99_05150 [Candidatus Bathyarchaeia archaeon]